MNVSGPDRVRSERHIIVLQPHLEFGGAERQTVILLNYLARQETRCTLILHEKKGGLLDQLDDRVEVVSLGLENHLASAVVALRLRSALARLEPGFVIVKLWSSILACAMVDRFVPKHVYSYCEDLDPADHAEYIRLGTLKQKLIKQIFRRRPNITANTNRVAAAMKTAYGIKGVEVIPSVVDIKDLRHKAHNGHSGLVKQPGRISVLTVGSLIKRKGLYQILEGLDESNLKIDWNIIGEGPERENLASLAADRSRNGSNVQITLLGGTPNPYPAMADAAVLVHGAKSEAFGIVVIEALGLGTPVVAADAIGPTEMVEVLGDAPSLLRLFKADSAADLARNLNEVVRGLESPPNQNAGSDYISRYSIESTATRWLDREARLSPLVRGA